MAYETKELQGSLFKRREEDRQSEKSSQYSGKAMINGQLMFVDAWINTKQDGEKYFSLRFKPMERQGQRPQQQMDYGAPRKPQEQRQQSNGNGSTNGQNGQRSGRYVPSRGVTDDEVPF